MKKPSLAIIIGGAKPKPEAEKGLGGELHDEEGESDTMEYSEDQKTMASELMDAVKAGDTTLFLEAFHGLFRSYEMEPHEEAEH